MSDWSKPMVKHLTLTRVQSHFVRVILILSSHCIDTACEKIDILGRDWQCRNHAAYKGGSDGLYIKIPSLRLMMIWLAKTEKHLDKSDKSIPIKAKLKKGSGKSWVKPETERWNASADSKCRKQKKSCERAGAGEVTNSSKSQKRRSKNRSYLGGSFFINSSLSISYTLNSISFSIKPP